MGREEAEAAVAVLEGRRPGPEGAGLLEECGAVARRQECAAVVAVPVERRRECAAEAVGLVGRRLELGVEVGVPAGRPAEGVAVGAEGGVEVGVPT